MTLRARLIFLLIAAILPLIAVEIYSEIQIRESREAEIGRDASRLMQLVAAEQGRVGETTHQLLNTFSQLASIRQQNWPGCTDVAGRIFGRIEGYVNLGVADLDGNILCSAVPTLPGPAYRDSPIYAAIDRNVEFATGAYRIGRLGEKKRILPYSMPWRDDNGTVRGVIFATVDVDWLARQYMDRFFSADVTMLIADSEGTIIVRLPNQADYVGKPIGAAYMQYVKADRRGIVNIIGVDGQRRVLAYDPVATDPGHVYVGIGISPDPYFAQMNIASRQKALLIAIAIGLALLAIWFGSDTLIRRPVDRLLSATERWRHGDSAARVAVRDRPSEMGRLGIAFNEMAVSLEERQRKQKNAEDALARVNVSLERQVKEEVEARESAQRTLQQVQKMDAVGRLTTGIAHDFNNLLMAIIGNLELLQNRIAKDERTGRLLSAAQRAADRGAKLTQQLLAFSRQQRLESEPLDLNQVVENSRSLLFSSIGATVKIETMLAADLWLALGDANQMELMILNLAINARDAMNDGGAITIRTANVTLSEPERPEEPVPGDYVMLSVADTGPGIAADVVDHVFEPFFTTKAVGKGSGLGLPQVLGVAQQLGGGVRIDTTVGEGTHVKIYLPRAVGIVAAGTDSTEGNAALHHSARLGTILLVDDDAEVRAITAGMLKEAGHTVIDVGSGGAALERMDIEGEHIDVAILDFAMPGMNGAEVARIIRRNWHRVAILFITGFADMTVLSADATSDEILSKPFRRAELEDKLGFALQRAALLHGKISELRPPIRRT
jgi:signal transduction histidine kinase/ActR/RegA family two-component response regulator